MTHGRLEELLAMVDATYEGKDGSALKDSLTLEEIEWLLNYVIENEAELGA
jgi:hypothetical protein